MQEENPHVGGVFAPFVLWLEKQKHRADETGKVARYILSAGPDLHSDPILREQVRSYGEREEYESCLRYIHGLTESSMEVFNRVFDEYVRSGPAGDAYDEKVRQTMTRLGNEFGEPKKPGEDKQRTKNENEFSETSDAEFFSVIHDLSAVLPERKLERNELIEALEERDALTPELRQILESPEAVEEESPTRTLIRRASDGLIAPEMVEDEAMQMGLLEERRTDS